MASKKRKSAAPGLACKTNESIYLFIYFFLFRVGKMFLNLSDPYSQ